MTMEDLGEVPLAERRRLLHLSKKPSSFSPCSSERPLDVPIQRASFGAKECSSLPRGVHFNPTDADLLWHLLAKVGKGSSEPHPLIHEFIICLDEFDRFGCTHPQNLPGFKEYGTTYFFHKSFKTYGSDNVKPSEVHDSISGDVHWQKSGKARPLIFDGIHQGYKTIMTLHVSVKVNESLLPKENFKRNWVMHQYHLGTPKVEGEFVVSKIFPQRIRYAIQKADGAQETDEYIIPLEDIVITKDLQPSKGQKLAVQNYAKEVLDSQPPSIGSAVKIEHLEESPANNGLGTIANAREIDRGLASFAETVQSIDMEHISKAEVKEETDDGLSNGMKRKLIPQKPDMLSSRLVSSKGQPANTMNSQASHLPLRGKRKKTATESVEQALEEDVPGLLEVLRVRGVSADEMKLYGAMEDDEALEGEEFSELETVIHKIYSAQASLFKISLAHHVKGPKAVYCVACLLSLVEQSRYMQFRNNRTEWGWCRDLQSFIFVFENHNRIVLERPEYGYATYFFGILDLLPIYWQINRIVTAMKLTSCSRTTLIEDRPLVVGQDLTEGEARVLEEYGWTRNCGLGTMLDYRYRVMHDRKYVGEISEWRVKIGRMLVEGLESGRSLPANLPKKFIGNAGNCNFKIKEEDD